MENNRFSDFNDLHVNFGIEAVRDQLKKIEPAPKMALYALGFKENEYFFTSSQNRQVIGVTSFTEDAFLKLMPIAYWEAIHPNDKGKVDWTAAKSELISKCQKKGIFHAHRVRGAGVWMDSGHVIVNMGDHLIVDGKRVELGSFKSRNFYTLGKTLQTLHETPLTNEECETLRSACEKFKWTKPESGVLLAGALVLSRICGAIPVRPHIWITGGAETGKTTLLERLIRPILGESKLYVQGNTTEAGVRQSLKADAVPILFDEFETNGPKSAENIAACIELMRASWSDSGAVIIKGGVHGNAQHFQVRFSAFVSSIRTRLINDADRGRFAVLELAPHGADAKHWQGLSLLLSTIDDEFSERLFARTVSVLPILLQNFALIKKALAKRSGARFGDTYGMILAGYSILIQTTPIDDSDAEYLADHIGLDEEKSAAKNKDENDALSHILTTKISYDTATGRKEALISELIERVHKKVESPMNDLSEENALLRIGIKVFSDSVAVAQANHAQLESQVFRGTRWSQTWAGSLGRLDGAAKRCPVRIAGKVTTCVKIPIAHFLDTVSTL